jgi:hypothetical protein
VKLLAIGPRAIPVITLDANEHTITQQIFCDGDSVISIQTSVDGVYLMTTYLPPPAPTGLRILTP